MGQAFVLDSKTIIERLAGEIDIYWMMIDMYLQELDNNCASIAAAYQAGDAAALHREAHTLKGLLATFTDDFGSAQALAIEKLAKEKRIEGLGDAVSELQQRLREVGEVLRQEVAQRS